MRRSVLWAGAALIAAGLAVFLWKTLVLGLPIVPSDPKGLWRVELEISARGSGERGSVRASLPSSGAGQVVYDEHVLSDRLLFTIRTEDTQRVGVWSGHVGGIHQLTHSFRVQLSSYRTPLPTGIVDAPPAFVTEAFVPPTPELPAQAPAVEEMLATLDLPEQADVVGRARTIFGFVADEVATVDRESDDALLTLAAREGSQEGKARLLATLLRGVRIPARVVRGLELGEDRDPRETAWVEAWIGNGWVPMSPSLGFFATRPDDILRVSKDAQLVEATGVAALAHRYRSLRERLSPEELAVMMLPPNPVLAELSLYRLPVATQGALRLLLLVPLGAFVMAIFRNVIGLPAFGTFLPVLIALALRGTDLLTGLAMVFSVILLGVVSRLFMERLHLLLVPRICILVCLVILSLTLFAVAGRGFQDQNLFGGVLLPIVILSMLIERFSITTAEEGMRAAIVRLCWSLSIAVALYPLFRSATAAHIFFGFPELVLCVMGLLVWVGGYTGYRLSEVIRFRSFAVSEPPL
jgi:hypothetical protein